ncbi:MAG: tRNA lysidine(34) synthetase TilS [candidate division Zixibacteria bacterium]|nr:tRNA lysidine(34) synthetase TilS [candidate division Zixibacteria bacterium]MCI0597087.1 tRNA lysidine(34) synthetase TilS [candidate division Zixibacteria bacterium]
MVSDFVQKTADFIQKKKLLGVNEKILVACSGGPDSVALLFALRALSKPLKLKLGMAHLNHLLRPEAPKDAAFVKKLAHKLKSPFFYSEVDTKTAAKENKWSQEEAGRNLRYRFFEQVAKDEQFDKIATAHTADDAAETVLLQILRGTGGPAGIPAKRGNIIRPILWATRADVFAFLKAKKLAYRTDPSNKGNRFTRNRVRNELLPLLEKKYNPQIRQALFRLAQIFEDEKNFLQAEAKRAIKKALVKNTEALGLKLGVLSKAPKALQREVLQMACEQYFDLSLDFASTNRLLTLLEKPGKIELAKNLFADSTRKGILWFYRLTKKPEPVNLKLPLDKVVKANGLVLKSKRISRNRLKTLMLPTPWQAYLDAGRLKAPLLLRPAKEGDRFIPLGMKAPKKVGDFFTDAKVPAFQRQNALLLTSAGKICWVVGHRIAEDFKVGPKTKQVIYLKAEPNER